MRLLSREMIWMKGVRRRRWIDFHASVLFDLGVGLDGSVMGYLYEA